MLFHLGRVDLLRDYTGGQSMENERTRSKGSCCVCAAWLLRLLLLLLDYVWLTGALTRADHGLVGTALVRYIVSLVY